MNSAEMRNFHLESRMKIEQLHLQAQIPRKVLEILLSAGYFWEDEDEVLQNILPLCSNNEVGPPALLQLAVFGIRRILWQYGNCIFGVENLPLPSLMKKMLLTPGDEELQNRIFLAMLAHRSDTKYSHVQCLVRNYQNHQTRDFGPFSSDEEFEETIKKINPNFNFNKKKH